MAEDWAAVADAISSRARQLGLRQWELAQRSGVSQATVRELQLRSVVRQRSGRTLEALSVALELHPGHLLAVLHGRTPLQPGETGDPAVDEVPKRLDSIESHLTEISQQINSLRADIAAMRNVKGS